MSDALRRAARTFFQAFVGTLGLLAIPALTDVVRAVADAKPYEIDFAFWQNVVIAACASGMIALISWVQNALEDKGIAGKHLPAVLKSPPSPGQNPVPDNASGA